MMRERMNGWVVSSTTEVGDGYVFNLERLDVFRNS